MNHETRRHLTHFDPRLPCPALGHLRGGTMSDWLFALFLFVAFGGCYLMGRAAR